MRASSVQLPRKSLTVRGILNYVRQKKRAKKQNTYVIPKTLQLSFNWN
jgi:hypothetical protein